ncbi:M13 family metallopeptidase [Fretibacter rubidus]|uniref:M13 family metallopeptidase n=1 Tax=Fretibacter rubidus TaxID=570162 RepID=UPI003529D92B
MTFKSALMTRVFAPSLLGLTLALAGCNVTEPNSDTNGSIAAPAQKPVLGSFGVELSNIDESVKPGDNFFKYVNGAWLENTEIPADKSRYGAFTQLRDLSDDRVKVIIEEAAAKDAPMGSEEQKIGDFYAAFMDTDAIEAAGLTPVKADIARIRAVSTHEDAAALMGDPSMSVRAPVGGWVDVDVKDIENYIFYMTQSGLGMPNKNYYLDDDDKSVELRAAYVTYLTTMLREAGLDNPEARAKKVMAFETEMAGSHWTPTKRRDRSLTYNKMSLDELKSYAPGFPWESMLSASNLSDQDTFIIRENDAIQGLAATFAKTDMDTIRDYMTAGYLGSMSAYLPASIDNARFDFYGKALSGTTEQRERWKRAVSQIDGTMGEMVGKVYVKKHFPPESKRQMDALIENLRASFEEGLKNLDWMGEETKVEALDKLAKFNPKIGYPEEWTDYSALKVDRSDLIGTVKSANAWSWNEDISKLGGPIDRGEWGMNPQTVNAYYRPSLNEIVFPAAILQAPFFDPNADPAVNYGGIGAVIGHEMGHGFDDQGRKTDGNGEQRDWWSESDGSAFKERSDALVAQYDAFEPLPGENLNGRLSLGENIGDLTGVTMAYKAYQKSLGGKPAPVIDGLTGDQRFFLAYAQIWRIKFRDEAMRAQIKNGPHSPGEFRANGIVRNIDAWYEAFNIQPGDALYVAPENRVKIW